jgi:hypothetical protein
VPKLAFADVDAGLMAEAGVTEAATSD